LKQNFIHLPKRGIFLFFGGKLELIDPSSHLLKNIISIFFFSKPIRLSRAVKAMMGLAGTQSNRPSGKWHIQIINNQHNHFCSRVIFFYKILFTLKAEITILY
jgi:hypothetical protein